MTYICEPGRVYINMHSINNPDHLSSFNAKHPHPASIPTLHAPHSAHLAVVDQRSMTPARPTGKSASRGVDCGRRILFARKCGVVALCNRWICCGKWRKQEEGKAVLAPIAKPLGINDLPVLDGIQWRSFTIAGTSARCRVDQQVQAPTRRMRGTNAVRRCDRGSEVLLHSTRSARVEHEFDGDSRRAQTGGRQYRDAVCRQDC